MNKRGVTTVLMLAFAILAVIVYQSATRPESGSLSEDATFTPVPSSAENQEAAYVAAQATLVAGQSEMMALSHQATVVSQNMDQAANAAAQATMDVHRRQLMELSIRGTEISQNMARAAATQQFITEQTRMVWNATATAQSQAATATFSAYVLDVTQSAQAQAILDVRVAKTAQANATLTAYSLTATPWAAIQADVLRTQNEKQRRAWWDEFVVTPFKAIWFALVAVLLIVGGVMAYQRLMPVLELRLRTISRPNDRPLLLVDGTIVDSGPSHHQSTPQGYRQLRYPRLLIDETPHVEVIGPSEPSITNWITEAEWKLRSDGWIRP